MWWALSHPGGFGNTVNYSIHIQVTKYTTWILFEAKQQQMWADLILKASWKDLEGRVIRSITRDAAVSQLKAIHEDIIFGKAKFDDVSSRLSGCSFAKRGGDLG
ncbi:hypothetical protein Tsubulata_005779 [Turnera subulata]|uniref:Peptidyl-prolyl cis-trans isomerase n=1 Tax=Turnera subulata TaxID=218843 RepID=A0A9Q0J303_9ROSI|nr:hypothetical protein Tsubulata_005779 [Turnera subulata]